jgi:hypothetical protein
LLATSSTRIIPKVRIKRIVTKGRLQRASTLTLQRQLMEQEKRKAEKGFET